MVDKLNMTRMSAFSGASGARKNNMSVNMSAEKGGMSPFKEVRPRGDLQSASVKKPAGRNMFDEADLNERIEFDKSLKVGTSSQKGALAQAPVQK